MADPPALKPVRIWLVGFGTVGRWLARALDSQAERLALSYGIDVTVVGLANRRGGFIYDANGLDLASVLEPASGGGSITEHPGVRRWPSTLEGLRATEADLPSSDGEPGVAHMREALERGIPVVTSNKWPVALHGVELAERAGSQGIAFRAESTVMSGTPVLSTLVDGLAGTVPIALRGVLNATVNFVLTRMAAGLSYDEALAEAQRAGLAERDPSADVEGHDAVAKVMILSAIVFGRQLRRDQVACRGVTDLDRAEIDRAASIGSERSPLESSPSSSAATIRWPASTGRPTPSCFRPARSARSRSSDRAPGRSLPGKVCSATSSPSRERAVASPARASGRG